MADEANPPIAAIATPSGSGGVGIVRISGHDLPRLFKPLFGQELVPRLATYCGFLDATGGVLDRGIALYFAAPHSYTGEDVIELQAHGGAVLMQRLLRRVLEAGRDYGLRLAQAGEFTRRAYLNDKIDLNQAEAVADLINAQTEAAAVAAQHSLSGEFSRRIDTLYHELVALRVLVESTLDFPEEEIDFLQASDAQARLTRLHAALHNAFASTRQGLLLQAGAKVVLAGWPNVGKSSLLNALAQDEVAIVTPIAGTTRDRIHAQIQLNGIALELIDTAGLRLTSDEVEQKGIEKSRAAIHQADVMLWLIDACDQQSAQPDAETAALLADLKCPCLRVINKVDICTPQLRAYWQQHEPAAIWISAKNKIGLEQLQTALLTALGVQAQQLESSEGIFSARTRHVEALSATLEHCAAAVGYAQQGNQQLELLAESLRAAQSTLVPVTGEFSGEDLLGAIFSQFCIGK